MKQSVLWLSIEALVSGLNHRIGAPGHSRLVAAIAVDAGRHAGLRGAQLERLRLGALVHDVGQLYWSDELLSKTPPLSPEDQAEIESHTLRGAALLRSWPALDPLAEFALKHQEWIDGSGYPQGLREPELPLEIQLVSLADVYEALTAPRASRGRAAMPRSQALELMREWRGRRWSASTFDTFVEASSESWDDPALG